MYVTVQVASAPSLSLGTQTLALKASWSLVTVIEPGVQPRTLGQGRVGWGWCGFFLLLPAGHPQGWL